MDVLAVFQGPDACISPSWYATQQETEKVVPTWNYAVVHAYDTLRVIDDAAWVCTQLEAEKRAINAIGFEPLTWLELRLLVSALPPFQFQLHPY